MRGKKTTARAGKIPGATLVPLGYRYIKGEGRYEIDEAEAATVREAAPRLLQAVCQGLDWDVGVLWTLDRSAGVLRCLEGFRRRGIPVDALGIQSHIGSGNNPGDGPAFGPHDEAEAAQEGRDC